MTGHPYSLPFLPYDHRMTGYDLTPATALEPSVAGQISLTVQVEIPIRIHYIYVLNLRPDFKRTVLSWRLTSCFKYLYIYRCRFFSALFSATISRTLFCVFWPERRRIYDNCPGIALTSFH